MLSSHNVQGRDKDQAAFGTDPNMPAEEAKFDVVFACDLPVLS
jgi:hypothetical protein